MKQVILLAVLLLYGMAMHAQIRFENALSWQEVKEKAKKENKYIFIDAYTTWCGPCKQMENEVYVKKEAGEAMNEKFVAVKVQMDTTASDNAFVKSWYADAEQIKVQYKVAGYPSYLFLSADGEVIYKDLGYKDLGTFVKMVHFAADPERGAFRADLEDWKTGKKDYSVMPGLVKMVRDVLGNRVLSLEIARDYKRNYLDKLPQGQLLSNENLLFIVENGGQNLLNSNDPYFKALYINPEILDATIDRSGYGKLVVNGVIAKEEIVLKLFRDGKLLQRKPDWEKWEQNIKSKYSKIDAQKLMLNEKISYYRKIEDWNLYTLYKSEKIKKDPPKAVGMDIFFALNSPAWDAFLNCGDPKALKRALDWSELSLKLEKRENHVQYLDTKANLQYKLGKTNEAIATEKEAIDLEDSISVANGRKKGEGFVPEYKETLEKMRAGQVTWPVKNHAGIKKD